MRSCPPPRLGHALTMARDEAVASTLATSQQEPPPANSTHALPASARGASLPFLAHHATERYLGAFFRVAGPLQQRLTTIGGRTNRSVALMLATPTAFRGSQPWTNFVCTAHSEACVLEQSVTVAEHSTANLIAPRGNIITSVGDPSSIAQDLLPANCTDVIPHLVEVVAASKGVKFIPASIHKPVV